MAQAKDSGNLELFTMEGLPSTANATACCGGAAPSHSLEQHQAFPLEHTGKELVHGKVNLTRFMNVWIS